MSDEPDNKVLDWLGMDDEGVPYYLHPLNLVWSKKGVNFDLQVYRNIAERLAGEPKYLRELIRTGYWRLTLVGCVSIILLKTNKYCSDLKYSFNKGSFVSPQIAVSLGLLCPDEAIAYFTEVVRSADGNSSSKAIISAHRVLTKLCPKSAAEFKNSVVLQKLENDDRGVASDIVENHWEFWRSFD